MDNKEMDNKEMSGAIFKEPAKGIVIGDLARKLFKELEDEGRFKSL